MHQEVLWGRVAKPAPGHDCIQVQSHTCGSLKLKAHKQKITEKHNGNNKKANTIKDKKKNGENEDSAIPNVQEDWKESKQLAHSLHIQ